MIVVVLGMGMVKFMVVSDGDSGGICKWWWKHKGIG